MKKIGSIEQQVSGGAVELQVIELRLSYISKSGKCRYHVITNIDKLDYWHLLELVKLVEKENPIPLKIKGQLEKDLLDA